MMPTASQTLMDDITRRLPYLTSTYDLSKAGCTNRLFADAPSPYLNPPLGDKAAHAGPKANKFLRLKKYKTAYHKGSGPIEVPDEPTKADRQRQEEERNRELQQRWQRHLQQEQSKQRRQRELTEQRQRRERQRVYEDRRKQAEQQQQANAKKTKKVRWWAVLLAVLGVLALAVAVLPWSMGQWIVAVLVGLFLLLSFVVCALGWDSFTGHNVWLFLLTVGNQALLEWLAGDYAAIHLLVTGALTLSALTVMGHAFYMKHPKQGWWALLFLLANAAILFPEFFT